jgi:hypothetical protein
MHGCLFACVEQGVQEGRCLVCGHTDGDLGGDGRGRKGKGVERCMIVENEVWVVGTYGGLVSGTLR